MYIFLETLTKIISIVFVFGTIILFHELGHFLCAKKIGVGVEKFSIGFGPALFRKKKGETEYAISLIPVGGYVKMTGDNLKECKREKNEFYSKTPFQRIAIVLAGPIMSFALAFLMFYIISMVGVPAVSPEARVGGLLESYPAHEAGLKEGDQIIAIDGMKVASWQEMTKIIREKAGKEILLTIKRENKILFFPLTPKAELITNREGEKQEVGRIGIFPYEVSKKFNPISSLYNSAEMLGRTIFLMFWGIIQLIVGEVPPQDIGGPVLIARLTARVAEEGIVPILQFTGLISIVVGIFNLFPIPVLDGGHILFFLIEAIRKKPLSEKVQLVAQKIGLALILGILLFATYNDIIRDYSKIFPQ